MKILFQPEMLDSKVITVHIFPHPSPQYILLDLVSYILRGLGVKNKHNTMLIRAVSATSQLSSLLSWVHASFSLRA